MNPKLHFAWFRNTVPSNKKHHILQIVYLTMYSNSEVVTNAAHIIEVFLKMVY